MVANRMAWQPSQMKALSLKSLAFSNPCGVTTERIPAMRAARIPMISDL